MEYEIIYLFQLLIYFNFCHNQFWWIHKVDVEMYFEN